MARKPYPSDVTALSPAGKAAILSLARCTEDWLARVARSGTRRKTGN